MVNFIPAGAYGAIPGMKTLSCRVRTARNGFRIFTKTLWQQIWGTIALFWAPLLFWLKVFDIVLARTNLPNGGPTSIGQSNV